MEVAGLGVKVNQLHTFAPEFPFKESSFEPPPDLDSEYQSMLDSLRHREALWEAIGCFGYSKLVSDILQVMGGVQLCLVVKVHCSNRTPSG